MPQLLFPASKSEALSVSEVRKCPSCATLKKNQKSSLSTALIAETQKTNGEYSQLPPINRYGQPLAVTSQPAAGAGSGVALTAVC